MSKYTTELRFICEMESGLSESAGFNSVATIIETARPKIFNFNYPIFTQDYKKELETVILKHYYTREICEETYGLWKLRLDARMNEIMPYFNKLYESTLLEFNPLDEVDLTKTHEGTHTEDISGNNNSTRGGQNTDTTTLNSAQKDKYSETPQGSLQDLEQDKYLTNARILENSGSNTLQKAFNETLANTIKTDVANADNFTETIKGKSSLRSYGKLLQEYRQGLIMADKQVCDALSDLFFGLW